MRSQRFLFNSLAVVPLPHGQDKTVTVTVTVTVTKFFSNLQSSGTQRTSRTTDPCHCQRQNPERKGRQDRKK